MFYSWNSWTGEYDEHDCPVWWMLNDHIGYYRIQRTQQEMTRWYRDLEEPVKLRQRRSPKNLNPWIIETIPSRCCSKSWKDLYKIRRQWQAPKTIVR